MHVSDLNHRRTLECRGPCHARPELEAKQGIMPIRQSALKKFQNSAGAKLSWRPCILPLV